jgi:hypothetical protein
MRVFAKPMGIERLSLEARIAYTGFALFTLIGLGTSVWLYTDDGLGTSAAATTRYFLGDEAAAGAALELPANLPSTALRFEKPARQVIETLHFHVFSMGVYLLVIAHLFMMTRHATRTKAWIIALSAAATLVHIAAPPLVRFASAAFAPLMFPSAALMATGLCYMILRPTWEMWTLGGLESGE